MVQGYAKLVGAFVLAAGLLGGVSLLTPQGLFLGIFRVDMMHNLIHVMTGLVLLLAGFSAPWELARRIVLGMAAFYGLLTVLGFLAPEGRILGMQLNMADNVLHLTLTASALVFALPVQRYPTRP